MGMYIVSYCLRQFDGATKRCPIKCLKNCSDSESRYEFQAYPKNMYMPYLQM